MDLNQLSKLAQSESFFLVLLVAGIVYVAIWVRAQLQENKTDSKRREEQLIDIYKEQIEKGDKREEDLMRYLDKNGEQLENVADTLKDVQNNIATLEGRVEDNFMSVWKELGKHENKIKE